MPQTTAQTLSANPAEVVQQRSRNRPGGQPLAVTPHTSSSVVRKQSTLCVKSVPWTQLPFEQTCGVQRCAFMPVSSQRTLLSNVQALVSTQTVSAHIWPSGKQMPPEQQLFPLHAGPDEQHTCPGPPQLAGVVVGVGSGVPLPGVGVGVRVVVPAGVGVVVRVDVVPGVALAVNVGEGTGDAEAVAGVPVGVAVGLGTGGQKTLRTLIGGLSRCSRRMGGA